MERQVRDPWGRIVVFDLRSRRHLERRSRYVLLDQIEAIIGAVRRPDHHELDLWPERERFYRQHLDGQRWLRVVVDFDDEPARIVTAIVQRYDPWSRQ
jgi:hypothetical protein